MAIIKVPLILFSGGLDSSFLLQQELTKGDVEVLYVKGVLHDGKMEEEQSRRYNIIRILEKKTGNKVRKEHVVNLGPMPFGNMTDSTFTQPSMWLMGALMVSDFRIHSKLLIAYVSGDQIMALTTQVKTAWTSLQEISKKNDTIPVEFPLCFDTKIDIIQDLKIEVVRQMWYCEAPRSMLRMPGTNKLMTHDEVYEHPHDSRDFLKTVYFKCGKCMACRRMKETFYAYRLKYPHNKPYSGEMIKVLHGMKNDRVKLLSTPLTER